MAIFDALSEKNESFRVYISWGGLLLIKMLLMALATGVQRARKGAAENPEDLKTSKDMELKKDESVERLRRAHLNDLENIPAFLFAAFWFVLAEPPCALVTWLIRIAVTCRFLHTFVYAVYPLPAPTRSVCWFVCYFITIFMTVWSIVIFFHF